MGGGVLTNHGLLTISSESERTMVIYLNAGIHFQWAMDGVCLFEFVLIAKVLVG